MFVCKQALTMSDIAEMSSLQLYCNVMTCMLLAKCCYMYMWDFFCFLEQGCNQKIIYGCSFGSLSVLSGFCLWLNFSIDHWPIYSLTSRIHVTNSSYHWCCQSPCMETQTICPRLYPTNGQDTLVLLHGKAAAA